MSVISLFRDGSRFRFFYETASPYGLIKQILNTLILNANYIGIHA